jgi:hypothetical protein
MGPWEEPRRGKREQLFTPRVAQLYKDVQEKLLHKLARKKLWQFIIKDPPANSVKFWEQFMEAIKPAQFTQPAGIFFFGWIRVSAFRQILFVLVLRAQRFN